MPSLMLVLQSAQKQKLSHATIRVTQDREISSVSYDYHLFAGELPSLQISRFDMLNLEISRFGMQNLEISRVDMQNLEISRFDTQNLEILKFDMQNLENIRFRLQNRKI